MVARISSVVTKIVLGLPGDVFIFSPYKLCELCAGDELTFSVPLISAGGNSGWLCEFFEFRIESLIILTNLFVYVTFFTLLVSGISFFLS